MSTGNQMIAMEKLVELVLKCYAPGQLAKLRESNETLWSKAILALAQEFTGNDYQSPFMANIFAEYAEHIASTTDSVEFNSRLEDAAFTLQMSTYVQMDNLQDYTEWAGWRMMDFGSDDAEDRRANAKVYFHSTMRVGELQSEFVRYPLLRAFKSDGRWTDGTIYYNGVIRHCLMIIELIEELDGIDLAAGHMAKMKDDINRMLKSDDALFRGVAVMAKAIRQYIAAGRRPSKTQTESILRTIRQSIKLFEVSGKENRTGEMSFLALDGCAGIIRLGAILLHRLRRDQEAAAYCQKAIEYLQKARKIINDDGTHNQYVDPLQTREYKLSRMLNQYQHKKQ